ncbi:MAG: bifunctional DNA primase/polymerase [Planctomycetota bacterium]|nr:bifunctional DNA primase/polymerase [Planctomycetota bacterium]
MANPVYEAIRKYVAHGICALPAIAKKKRPAIPWREFTRRLPKPDEINAWERNRYGDGVAVVCGAVSGNLECIDLDSPEAIEYYFDLMIHIGQEGLLARCYIERTPRGGMHVIYRAKEKILPNRVLARDKNGKILIETRGEGGIVLVYPTPGYIPDRAIAREKQKNIFAAILS